VSPSIDRLGWDNDGVVVGGTRFRVGYGADIRAGPGELLLMKSRSLIERHVDLIKQLKPKRIVELGIWHGGSVAFLALVAEPDKLVAIDIRPNASEQFDAWLRSHEEVVRPYFCVDQADAIALRSIVANEFAGAPLDLVIDDASHLLDPTRSSFNALFPLLRPGGVYVIEDWAEQHELERQMVRDAAVAERIRRAAAIRPELWERTPLTRLVFEIVVASVYTDLIDGIRIHAGWVSLNRGTEPVNPETFDVAQCLGIFGRRVLGEGPGRLE
jgi:predicted O-methyltransferase YrrM